MRGIIGLILAGLGAFLILVAILLPTWVVGRALKFPLNEYETATLEAGNASYFSVSLLRERTDVRLEATYTIKGDASAGNSSTAVWNEYSYVYDLTNRQPVQQMTRTFAFNRRSGLLVDCCGASVNGDKSVRQTGLLGYVFPIGTQKQTYQVFDTTLVDPETGALVDVNEQQSTTLRTSAAAAPALVGFDADLIATPASVTQIVALDSSGRSELTLIETTLPLALGIAGGVVLLAGILLSRKAREDAADLDGVTREVTTG